MRLLITSDWHLDASTAGFDRFDDVSDAVDRTVAALGAHDVAAYLFLGDLCDPGPRAHRAVDRACAVAREIDAVGVPSFWLTGNHDVVEDGTGSHAMMPLAHLGGRVRLIDSPQLFLIKSPDGDEINAFALPFVPRARAYDPDELVRSYDGPVPRVVVGHLNLEGIGPGSETEDMPRGREVFWPLAAIREKWPNALLVAGHYHRRQLYAGVYVVGALERLTFGEENYEPGFLVIDV